MLVNLEEVLYAVFEWYVFIREPSAPSSAQIRIRTDIGSKLLKLAPRKAGSATIIVMGGVPSVPTDPGRSLNVLGAEHSKTGTLAMALALQKPTAY